MIKNFINDKEAKTDSRIGRNRLKSADTIINEDVTILIDLSKNIDRLIGIIIELQSDFHHLKQSLTIYLNFELIFKMPCVMLTIASITKMPDLD